MAGPTRYADLDDVLRELVDGAREALGATFSGAYLLGSFALADADEHSDVDFLVVLDEEVSPRQLTELQDLHGRLYALETPWAQHLEGSYAPKTQLRRVDPCRSPWLYLDNGASTLIWDGHCNTAVVRWTLREHGVGLAGPDPKSIVEPVSAEELRAEARLSMSEYVAWAPEPTKAGPMSRWKQPYLVLTFCRILHTLHTGTVGSKREAGTWAIGALAAEWSSLVQQALDDRPDPWLRVHQPADPEAIERTLAFAEYACAQSKSY